ncbi:heme exporter protein CcmA [Magnetococcus marinus MC-1]|uniref:Heme exporter protein CcmA n=1 Tax=Magnetococcus marinus (strain ATCC BAA-1437 / JCM 17883 / MC-1) TaxID=156889 RepID=A0LDE0_MAGMM|nr:heme ABC exporter ATP-binding protein CcmA [Magnetococcus marinus]ABK45983.1 heme exporter protein CcmA [Magnetococcus marinus MC-1]
MARLEVENIHYGFGRHKVLKGIDLTAEDGECLVLFGVNGAGKSTLLNILALRYRPKRGSYRLNGQEVWDNPDYSRSQIVTIAHHSHLYGHLTPVENLQFFSAMRDLERTDEQIKQCVRDVGLSRFLHRPVKGFSAGMRKRVALARVLLANPPLLLLDEPYSALDHQGVQWLNKILNAYIKEGGTLIIVTHDPDRVAALPYRALRVSKGLLLADTVDADFREEEEMQVC